MGILDDKVLRRHTAMKEMLDIARDIVADGVVSEEEARTFKEWIDRHPDMLGVWPVSELVGILSRALADGTLSPSEQAELAAVLERITGA